jgi:hypothetical protein
MTAHDMQDDEQTLSIELGRRRGDPKLKFDPHRKRACLHNVRVGFLGGAVFHLEPIEAPTAVVLVCRDWGARLFVLNPRVNWKDADYFDFAEPKIKALELTDAALRDPENGDEDPYPGNNRRVRAGSFIQGS